MVASNSAYDDVRAAIADKGSDARVEVNQRALIDKILARYASAGAVYRELLQNSNDAEATTAEIIITTSSSNTSNNTSKPPNLATIPVSKPLVTQVIYRNNGQPFRPQDWARLRKIAEGNPDETKVGAFGVGAYTMFSICEEPLVVSGKKGEEEAMAFFWKGDALWTKTGAAPPGIVDMSASLREVGDVDDNQWTSFILPSRDPYPLPDLVEFGQFLMASLTFTQCLKSIKVYVDQTLHLDICKSIIESHTIATPKASSWWKNDGACTTSSSGMFMLGKGSDLTQTSVQMSVSLRRDTSSESQMENSVVRARYASAMVKAKIPSDIEKRIIRVTKKKPPKELSIQIFLDAANNDEDVSNKKSKFHLSKLTTNTKKSRAALITDSFAPTPGSGRIFIGFRTSQTTGLGIHLAAPLMPTVEREAIDFVDPALREFNSELLECGGILMRLALEHEMGRLGMLWDANAAEREDWVSKHEEEKKKKNSDGEEKNCDGIEDGSTNDVNADSGDDTPSISGSLFSFATFMARGVKNTLVDAMKTFPEILGEDDETTELLNPIDDRPMSLEERDAIILMKAYCPRPSTPDSLVGEFLAKGFSRCLPSLSPPVLTMSGVVRGKDARLCHHGVEAFNIQNVVRRVMLENAREYHDYIACCRTLTIDDLILSIRDQILDEKMLVRLLKWWPKFCRVDKSAVIHGMRLKDTIRFQSNLSETTGDFIESDAELIDVMYLRSILYYHDNDLPSELPLPEAAFSSDLQNKIGLRTLEDNSYREWFMPLPFDIWANFISQQSCFIGGDEKDDELRIKVLLVLSKHFDSLEDYGGKKNRFVELLPRKSPCLPVDRDSSEKANSSEGYKTAVPSELYLHSSDLSAFAGVGTFQKVSKHVTKAGVSNEFLLALGVRKTISMDFLFLHLDTLKWNENPCPLINYLLGAELSSHDLQKLRQTRYLPAEDDQSAMYAPSELYFKKEELTIFPIKFLQIPQKESLSHAQRNFLIKLGVNEELSLSLVMNSIQNESATIKNGQDKERLVKFLDYLTRRLGPQGIYEKQYSTSNHFKSIKFLPCIRQNLETGEVVEEMNSPASCYSNPSALVMGFSVLDPKLLDTMQIATRTKCQKDPSTKFLLKRLLQLVEISKAKIDFLQKKGGSTKDDFEKLYKTILTLFERVFLYLSTRSGEFDKNSTMGALSKIAFIPCMARGQLVFYLPSQIFFKKGGAKSSESDDNMAETLFQEIEYNSFLSLAGVKNEPTLQEFFDLMIKKPDVVLDCLGEPKYKMLLRRIASNPPFKAVTKEIRSCPFLLGYLVVDEETSDDNNKSKDQKAQKAQYVLARAGDIYIVDNSFYRRQFAMLVSPLEQQLEEFYNKIGSKYVSEVVKKDFEVKGRVHDNTPLTVAFSDRIHERRPLLLSPSISSRPLASNAAKVLDDKYLEIFQVDDIQAKYSFERISKLVKVTCCAKSMSRQKTAIFITDSFDWFDVGTAIGGLILQRCQLEDAFFLSSLLESSIDVLRSRGFPVDRVLRPIEAPPPSPPPSQKPVASEPEPQRPPEQSSKSSVDVAKNDASSSNRNKSQLEGFETILQQMFPACNPDVIRGLLGQNPSKEKAREIAEQLASNQFPEKEESEEGHSQNENVDATSQNAPEKKETSSVDTAMTEPKPTPTPSQKKGTEFSSNPPPESKSKPEVHEKKPSKKPSSLMGKMFKGLRPPTSGLSKRHIHHQAHGPGVSDPNNPTSPENDAATQKSLEAMLQNTVESSRSVENAGVTSPETVLKSLPQGLECGENGCEVIPAQNIHPFQGPYGSYKSRNGIRVFSAASNASEFLTQHFDAVDRFAEVLHNLCSIYALDLPKVAIYYEPKGNTIAFNLNRALYFNLRFFWALHRDHVDSACYSYWFTVMSHELAHNLVTAHNKEHGKYTESFVMMYLPRLAKFLSQNSIA